MPVYPAGVTTHALLTDVNTPHLLAELEAAVCSETEADNKITAHAGVAAAHHTKTPTASGSYTGNSAVNRAIPHGLGVTPKIVLIARLTVNPDFFQIFGAFAGIMKSSSTRKWNVVTICNSTNFYVGLANAGIEAETANFNGYVYHWVAIG